MLTQQQLIVSKHFVKRKSIAFTSAELAFLKPRQHGDMSKARGRHKEIFEGGSVHSVDVFVWLNLVRLVQNRDTARLFCTVLLMLVVVFS